MSIISFPAARSVGAHAVQSLRPKPRSFSPAVVRTELVLRVLRHIPRKFDCPHGKGHIFSRGKIADKPLRFQSLAKFCGGFRLQCIRIKCKSLFAPRLSRTVHALVKDPHSVLGSLPSRRHIVFQYTDKFTVFAAFLQHVRYFMLCDNSPRIFACSVYK